jgi:hypothetical protein
MQNQAPQEFVAVLIDSASKKPVQSVRIILAPKKEGKPECSIDTTLTGVSNDRGEVRISKVASGEYVVFYNLTANINQVLNGKVVNYDPVDHGGDTKKSTAGITHISGSLGCDLYIMKGSNFAVNDGNLVVDGFYYAKSLDLAMISNGGELLKLRVPETGSNPVKIEINTDIGKL